MKRTVVASTRFRRPPAPSDDGLASLEPVYSVQVYEQIAAQIIEQIRTGRWRPGQRLPSERELSKNLQVSRPSLREALASLQVKGILKTRAGAGTFVAGEAVRLVGLKSHQPDQKMSYLGPVALLEAREHLDAATASIAASRRKRSERAETLLELMGQNLNPKDHVQREAWSDADRLFHREVGLMTGNPILVRFCDVVSEAMNQPLWRRLRDDAIAKPRRIQEYAAEHHRIYDAIVGGDSARSAVLAAGHVRRVRRDMQLETASGRRAVH